MSLLPSRGFLQRPALFCVINTQAHTESSIHVVVHFHHYDCLLVVGYSQSVGRSVVVRILVVEEKSMFMCIVRDGIHRVSKLDAGVSIGSI